MQAKIMEDMKAAMKAGEKEKVATLRMLNADIKNLKISKGGVNTELEESEIMALFQKNVKKRLDVAKTYLEAGRPELAEKEEAEAAIIKAYLPEEMSQEEIVQAVEEAIAETGATSKKQMGLVMKAVMAKYQGRIDGKVVQSTVMAKLS